MLLSYVDLKKHDTTYASRNYETDLRSYVMCKIKNQGKYYKFYNC